MTLSGPARRALTAVLVLASLVGGCKGEEDEAAVQERVAEKKTIDLMAEVSKARYEPPADGRLTEEQVRMFLEVKKRGQTIREAIAKERGDLATADLRAAVELGHNPKELLWVEERIAEAQEAEAGSALAQRVGRSRGEYLAMLEEERKAAADEARRAEIDRQIAEFKKAQEVRTEVSPEVRHNTELLARYKVELEEARLAEARLAAKQRAEEGR